MKLTTLLLFPPLYFSTSTSAACDPHCRKIEKLENICGGQGNCALVKTESCARELGRSDDQTLYTKAKGTKVEIFKDNGLSMFCHDSHCFRDKYCRIEIGYRDHADKVNDGDYVLPAYGGCCMLPSGYIESASIHEYAF